MKKLLMQMVGIILTVTMTMSCTVNTLAASRKRYIKEIRLCYAESYEEAVEEMGDDYTVLDHSLTEGSYSDEINGTQDVWVGYTTTTKATEAVTDIAAMNMYGEFDENGYDEIVEGFREQVQGELDALKSMIAEYRVNYRLEQDTAKETGEENATGKAHAIYDLLTYYLDDDCMEEGKPLSLAEVFLDENLCTDEHLTDILVQGNTTMILNVENILARAQNTGDTTWLQTLQKTTYGTMIEQYKETSMTHKTETAVKAKIDQDYAEDFEMLYEKWEELYNGLKAFEETGLDENSTQEEINAAAQAGDERMGLMIYYTIGVALKKMAYQDKTLFDYFYVPPQTVLDTVKDDPDHKKDRTYYPILASMSIGEKASLYTSDLKTLIQCGLQDQVDWDKVRQEFQEFEVRIASVDMTVAEKGNEENNAIMTGFQVVGEDNKAADYTFGEDSVLTITDQTVTKVYKTEPTSIFIGVNRDFYKGGVAMTRDAMDRMLETGTTPGGDEDPSVWTAKTIGLTVAASVALVSAISSFVMAGVKYYKMTSLLKNAFAYQKGFNLATYAATTNRSLIGAAEQLYKCYKVYSKNKGVTSTFKTDFLIASDREALKEAFSGNGTVFDALKSTEKEVKEKGVAIDKSKDLAKSSKRALYIGIGLSVLFIALTIWDMISISKQLDEIKKQQEEAEITEYIYDREIPPLMVWARNTEEDDGEGNISTVTDYLYYEVVPTITEEDADIYAHTQKQWVALYTSTDHACGDPILADSLVVQPGGGTPDNCNGAVHLFGDTRLTALNLHDASELQLVENDGNSGFGLFYKGDPYWQEGIKGSVFSDNPLLVSLAAGGLLAVCGAITVWVVRRKKNRA